jgi:hypothetical protein
VRTDFTIGKGAFRVDGLDEGNRRVVEYKQIWYTVTSKGAVEVGGCGQIKVEQELLRTDQYFGWQGRDSGRRARRVNNETEVIKYG